MARAGRSWLDYARGSSAPRIKAAPKRQRRRTVHVRSYCRRRGLLSFFDREQARKDMPF